MLLIPKNIKKSDFHPISTKKPPLDLSGIYHFYQQKNNIININKSIT